MWLHNSFDDWKILEVLTLSPYPKKKLQYLLRIQWVRTRNDAHPLKFFTFLSCWLVETKLKRLAGKVRSRPLHMVMIYYDIMKAGCIAIVASPKTKQSRLFLGLHRLPVGSTYKSIPYKYMCKNICVSWIYQKKGLNTNSTAGVQILNIAFMIATALHETVCAFKLPEC